MKKLLKISIILLLCLCIRVKGETYYGRLRGGENIGKIYIKKKRADGFTHYMTANFIYLDDKLVYCLEPYVIISGNVVEFDVYNKYYNLSEELWNRVKKIAYFGYNFKDKYHDHTADYWFVVTQVLIWKELTSDEEIFFTDKLNGNKISLFEEELNELRNLVNNYETLPRLNLKYDMYLGKEETYTDERNLLEYYDIEESEMFSFKKEGNTLTITPRKVGRGVIKYTRKSINYGRLPIVYQSNLDQDVMETGDIDEIVFYQPILISGGSFNIKKTFTENIDKYTTMGAKYNLINEEGEIIKILTTDENGIINIDNLPFGKYCLKEIKAPEGFIIDDQLYCYNIDENNLNVDITLYNKLIKGKIEITKVYASSETGIMTPEVNVKFGIYDESGKLVKEVTANNDGKINEELYYGKYVLKQLTTTDGYEMMEDFYFEIDENEKVISKVIADAKIITGSITINKYSDDKEPLEDVVFGLYKENKLIKTYVTNNEGIIEIKDLDLGKYEVREIETKEGYEIDNKIYEINLTKENNFIKIGAINKKVVILEVPDTYKNV